MEKCIHEIQNIETIGDLKAAIILAELPDDMQLQDCFGEGLLLRVYQDLQTNDKYATIE
jgi:hypothetical protein